MSFQEFSQVIRVKIFKFGTPAELEEEINEWIRTSSVNIVDIKYNVGVAHSVIEERTSSLTSYSALILYTCIDLRKQLNLSKSVPVPPEHMVGIEGVIDGGMMG